MDAPVRFFLLVLVGGESCVSGSQLTLLLSRVEAEEPGEEYDQLPPVEIVSEDYRAT